MWPGASTGRCTCGCAARSSRRRRRGAGVWNGIATRERPHRVASLCFSNADREHAVVDPRHHVLRGDDRGRPADASRPCAPGTSACLQRRARRRARAPASRRPRSMSGALPMTMASMSAIVDARVGERPVDRLANEPGRSTRRPRAESCFVCPTPTTAQRSAHHSPSRTATRFCCRHGPLVAWATARSADPAVTR